MGNGMNKVLPGLYVGNFRDSRDETQLKDNKITHILSIHDNAKPARSDMIYLCLGARDVGTQDLSQYFSQSNDFIHSARIYGGNVLIHCLAGMSRSVTLTVAYIMTVTPLGWRDALSVVRVARPCASPNFGFQKQLLAFQHERACQERRRLQTEYPRMHLESGDAAACERHLVVHRRWVLEGGDLAKYDEKTYPLGHNAYKPDGKTETLGHNTNTSGSANTKPSSDRTVDKDCSTDAEEKCVQHCADGKVVDPSVDSTAQSIPDTGSDSDKLLDELFQTSRRHMADGSISKSSHKNAKFDVHVTSNCNVSETMDKTQDTGLRNSEKSKDNKSPEVALVTDITVTTRDVVGPTNDATIEELFEGS